MSYEENVKNNNPIIHTIITNAIKNNVVPHAYLFTAQVGQEIHDEYLFLIQQLISKTKLRNPLAYSDLVILDGSKSLIKKEMVLNAINTLQQTALDKTGKKFLVIKNIENSNKYSMNSLLKFIEEPTENTYILMTTNKKTGILSTIKSRAQILDVKPISKLVLSNSLLKLGVGENISMALANISKSENEAMELYKGNIENTMMEIIDMMKNAINNKNVLTTKLGEIINKNNFEIIIKILVEFISDIWREKQLQKLSFPFAKEISQSYNLTNYKYDKALKVLNEFVVMRNYNVNFNAHKYKMIVELGECYE